MKVKNIMFFGFAAAILSAGAASAAVTHPTTTNYGADKTVADTDRKIVTSKAYVDTSTNKLAQDIRAINIPTATSDLTNDSGYITSADVPEPYDDTELAAKVEENKTAIATINASAPMNSGITAAKVSTYDGYADTIASKQTAALEAQGTSETSTVSNSDTSYPSSRNVQSYVAEQIAANNTSTGVANKQDKSGADYQMGNSSGGWTTMTQNQQDALNSGANATNIAQIATNTTAIAGKQATATVNYAVGNTDGTWESIAKPDTCTSTNPCAWVNNAWVPMAI